MTCICSVFFFFFKQKTAYEMRISDWSSDVCSSDLLEEVIGAAEQAGGRHLAVDEELETAEDQPVREGELDVFRREELLERLDRRIMKIGRESCRERVCQYV